MSEAPLSPDNPAPRRARWRLWLALCVLALLCTLCWLWWEQNRNNGLWPIVSGVPAPGAAAALQRAGIAPQRVTQILSPRHGLARTSYSAGTHGRSGVNDKQQLYGNAFDLIPALGAHARRKEIRALRLQGFAAWSRGNGEPGGGHHLARHYHIVWAGAKTKNADQRQQICSFVNGYLGLANGGARRKWRKDKTIRADEIAAVRRKYESVYGQGALDACACYEALHRPARSRA